MVLKYNYLNLPQNYLNFHSFFFKFPQKFLKILSEGILYNCIKINYIHT